VLCVYSEAVHSLLTDGITLVDEASILAKSTTYCQPKSTVARLYHGLL